MQLNYAVSVFSRFWTQYFSICHFFVRYCGIGYPPNVPLLSRPAIKTTKQLNNYLVKRSQLHNSSFRDATLLDLGDTMSSAMGQSSFKFAAAKDWNDLPKELGSFSSFKGF